MEAMTIAVGSNRTGTIFRPQRTTQLWFSEDSNNYLPVVGISPMGEMRTPGMMSRGTMYHMHFLHVDTQLTFVREAMQAAGSGTHSLTPPDIEDIYWWPMSGTGQLVDFDAEYFGVAEMLALIELLRAPGGQGHTSYIPSEEDLIAWLDSFTDNVLARYSRSVRHHFTYVPEIVTQRVRDLTYEVVRGRYTEYDRVMAIRDYLLLFPYTFNPPVVPYGVCFVDHFLFYAQRGYCTYFASAMAIMARIAGIPSRYVEGFVVPPHATTTEAVTITNRMAHAWAEVYLQGFGWVKIEATPTYAMMPLDIIPPPMPGLSLHDFEEEDWLEILRQMMEEQDNPGVPIAPVAITPVQAEEEPQSRSFLWLIVPALLLVYIGVRVTIKWRFRVRLRRIKSLPPNAQACAYFPLIMGMAARHCRRPLLPGETWHEYGKHMGRRFAFVSDSVFLRDIIKLYYRARYGAAEISDVQRNIMQASFYEMLDFSRRMSMPRLRRFFSMRS
jgi:hypothetical protein